MPVPLCRPRRSGRTRRPTPVPCLGWASVSADAPPCKGRDTCRPPPRPAPTRLRHHLPATASNVMLKRSMSGENATAPPFPAIDVTSVNRPDALEKRQLDVATMTAFPRATRERALMKLTVGTVVAGAVLASTAVWGLREPHRLMTPKTGTWPAVRRQNLPLLRPQPHRGRPAARSGGRRQRRLGRGKIGPARCGTAATGSPASGPMPTTTATGSPSRRARSRNFCSPTTRGDRPRVRWLRGLSRLVDRIPPSARASREGGGMPPGVASRVRHRGRFQWWSPDDLAGEYN